MNLPDGFEVPFRNDVSGTVHQLIEAVDFRPESWRQNVARRKQNTGLLRCLVQKHFPRLRESSVDDHRFAVEMLVSVHVQRDGLCSVAVGRDVADLGGPQWQWSASIAHLRHLRPLALAFRAARSNSS